MGHHPEEECICIQSVNGEAAGVGGVQNVGIVTFNDNNF